MASRAILYTTAECATALHSDLPVEIQLVSNPPQLQAGFALWLDDQGLSLIGASLTRPFRLSAQGLRRRRSGRSALVRACGAQGGQLLDVYAGFAVDSMTLAAHGFTVTGLEISPLIWMMAQDAVSRAALPVQLQVADGIQYMAHAADSGQRWQVVYLDPMFPARRKNALPGLAAQILQALAAPVENYEAALELALSIAPRVVLKRRLKDPLVQVHGRRPVHQIKGRTVRFDVYLAPLAVHSADG